MQRIFSGINVLISYAGHLDSSRSDSLNFVHVTALI